MELTPAAQKRLRELLPAGSAGFSVNGFLGTCRGSTPRLQPAQHALENQETVEQNGIRFFVNAELSVSFRDCELDYDPSLFGKGLTVVWPHRAGCNCHSD